MSRDAAESWQSLEEGVRDFESRRAKVSRVVASSHAESRAYVTFDRHQLGDFSPYVFVTDDSGESFRSITGGLPETGWVNVLVEHPRNPDLLFIGTEIGLFVTFDRGTHWERMTANFPTVPVDDLVIHSRDGDLVVGTHGRAIYILDDVTPLAKHAASGSDVELFPVREATVYLPWKHESYRAQRQFVGVNPPFGAIITYFVPEAGDDVTVEVTGGAGESIAELEGAGTRGFHRLVWDLRSRAPEELNGEHGPLVSPGRYTVRLRRGDLSRIADVHVSLDPRLDIPAEESRARYEFLTSLNDFRASLARAEARAAGLWRSSTECSVSFPRERLARPSRKSRTKPQVFTRSWAAPVRTSGTRVFRHERAGCSASSAVTAFGRGASMVPHRCRSGVWHRWKKRLG